MTIRKARESDEPLEERARVELEIRAEMQASAERLKALQARKLATSKAPRTRKSRSSGSQTVLVSASSSGRVASRTFVTSSVLSSKRR